MSKVHSIYEAKTHLSNLVKKAQAGETIYVGAYGHAQAVISPIPVKKSLNIGIWAHKKIPHAYKTDELVGTDQEISQDFEDSTDRPLL